MIIHRFYPSEFFSSNRYGVSLTKAQIIKAKAQQNKGKLLNGPGWTIKMRK